MQQFDWMRNQPCRESIGENSPESTQLERWRHRDPAHDAERKPFHSALDLSLVCNDGSAPMPNDSGSRQFSQKHESSRLAWRDTARGPTPRPGRGSTAPAVKSKHRSALGAPIPVASVAKPGSHDVLPRVPPHCQHFSSGLRCAEAQGYPAVTDSPAEASGSVRSCQEQDTVDSIAPHC